MCGCLKGNSNGSNINFTPQLSVQTCEYTLIALHNLLTVSLDNEKSLVQSQINTYTANCNMFRSVIIPLFNKYSIPYT